MGYNINCEAEISKMKYFIKESEDENMWNRNQE